ncbi:hypothetical protein CEXT_568621 [Caerostris extrusa]|uniref:Uncharacterized protein n=1 Tax=Caerostris extrusa TaxID=172846 RepID=A0AAV4YEI1_CAEEX|nr:hypothetical protein CEXT_568621 [Caerostris extrusa]
MGISENLKHLKTLELKTNHERRMAPGLFAKVAAWKKKSGSFTPRLARVPLSVCLRWGADNTFRTPSQHRTNELSPARQLVH